MFLQQTVPTSQLYWWSTIIIACIDLGFIGLLVKLISPARFDQLLRTLMGTAALCWAGIYTTAALAFWQECYQAVFPAWVPWAAPGYGLLLGGLAGLFWFLARKLPGHPIIPFILLGGLHSLPGHLLGIYSLDLLVKCPLLQQVSPSAALAFGIVEFVFYWGVILALSVVVQNAGHRLTFPTREV